MTQQHKCYLKRNLSFWKTWGFYGSTQKHHNHLFLAFYEVIHHRHIGFSSCANMAQLVYILKMYTFQRSAVYQQINKMQWED